MTSRTPDAPDLDDVADDLDDATAVAADQATNPPVNDPVLPAAEIEVAVLLVDVRSYLRRYVVMTEHQATAVTLWTAHTHAVDASDVTAYLHVTSAAMRTGKTRLLEVVETLVRRPWLTGRTTTAVLPRKIEAERPTLLLDESDAAFKENIEYAGALRGILNSGYKRSGCVSLCVGQGAGITYKNFSTFCPKAIAGIGELPGTVADRSIRIKLKRRRRDEAVGRWRERDAEAEAAPLRGALAHWAATAIEALRAAVPTAPEVLNDRCAEVWEPLFAIADLAGGEWPLAARRAAVALTSDLNETDVGIELLHDLAPILDALPETDTGVATADLLSALTFLTERPWATWSHGAPMTGRALAVLLKGFDIVPAGKIQIRPGGPVERGYRRSAFGDALTRYGVTDAPTPPGRSGKRERDQ